MAKKNLIISLLPLLLVVVIDTMGVGLIVPVVSPLFMQKINGILPPDTSLTMRDFLYGATFASYTLFMFIGAPFLGDLSDYLGRKKVLTIALAVTGIAYVISGVGVISHSVIGLIIGRCLAGFAAGSQPIAQAAIADVSTHENKTVNMGLLGFASCTGFVIGPIIGGYFANEQLVSWFGSWTPFFIAAFLALANAVGVWFAFKETYQPTQRKKLQLIKGFTVFLSAFSNKNIAPLMWVTLLAQTGFAAYLTFVSIFIVQAYHFTSIKVGHFMAFFGLILAINFMVLVRFAVKYFSLKNINIIALILTFFGLIGMLWPAEGAVWINIIPISIGNGLTYMSLLTLLSNKASVDNQGWIMGAISSSTAVAWTVGGLITGLGSVHAFLPFIIAALLIALSLTVFLLVSRK